MASALQCNLFCPEIFVKPKYPSKNLKSNRPLHISNWHFSHMTRMSDKSPLLLNKLDTRNCMKTDHTGLPAVVRNCETNIMMITCCKTLVQEQGNKLSRHLHLSTLWGFIFHQERQKQAHQRKPCHGHWVLSVLNTATFIFHCIHCFTYVQIRLHVIYFAQIYDISCQIGCMERLWFVHYFPHYMSSRLLHYYDRTWSHPFWISVTYLLFNHIQVYSQSSKCITASTFYSKCLFGSSFLWTCAWDCLWLIGYNIIFSRQNNWSRLYFTVMQFYHLVDTHVPDEKLNYTCWRRHSYFQLWVTLRSQ